MSLRLFVFLILCLANHVNTHAQAAKDYAVQVEAAIEASPASVTLNWTKIPEAQSYSIYKRNIQNNSWQLLKTIQDTFYQDTNADIALANEYKVESASKTKAYGYIYCGKEVAPVHHRGTLILVVDTLLRDSCANEISTLMEDIRADGWAVKRMDFSRSVSDKVIKDAIKHHYKSDAATKAVLILGHIAVPYSGNLYPDGHPDHQGAWPADVYYGDMDGLWTDNTVNITVASREQNKNVPGDGKWDQTIVPSKVELQVSRIDFYNMPLFAKSEVTLMKQYLNKLHSYKTNGLDIIKQGIVDDNFGGFNGEAFASTAWRNFAPLLGRDNILQQDFITSLNAAPYQWAYGCGGGSYTSCGGIGTTANFTANQQKGIFTILFGSYFGDWDSTNNFLRAPLCSDEPALISFWAGRPHWYFHHMALGENIGKGLLNTQNNYVSASTNYSPQGYLPGGIHVALMGDLTLRSDYVSPVTDLQTTAIKNQGAVISWAAANDKEVVGYYVYRSDSLWNGYEKISGLIADVQYADTVGTDGLKYYMVRPCRLENNPSGSYYNLGLGVIDSAYVEYKKTSSLKDLNTQVNQISCFPNPAEQMIHIHLRINHQPGNTLHFRILDINGQMVKERIIEHHQGDVRFTEDISQFQSGTYYIELVSDDRSSGVQKFIKM